MRKKTFKSNSRNGILEEPKPRKKKLKSRKKPWKTLRKNLKKCRKKDMIR
jgi:hypothetical protein